jgi:hypothetical protein
MKSILACVSLLVYVLRRLAQTFPEDSQGFCTCQRSRRCLFPSVNPAARMHGSPNRMASIRDGELRRVSLRWWTLASRKKEAHGGDRGNAAEANDSRTEMGGSESDDCANGPGHGMVPTKIELSLYSFAFL